MMLMMVTTLLPPVLEMTRIYGGGGNDNIDAGLHNDYVEGEMMVTIRLMEEKEIMKFTEVQEMILFPQEQGMTRFMERW